MPRSAPLRLAGGLLAVGALLAGCGAQDSSAGDRVDAQAEGVSEQGYVSGDGSTTIIAEADRVPAPAIVGTTLDGEPFALADLRGAVVVLNVWASWCAPCRAEAPDLQEVASEYEQTAAVQFVGLNTRDSAEAADAFVDRFGLTYPSVVDTDGVLQLAFRDSLPPAAIPSTVVIDPQGRVAARVIGAVDASTLRGLIEPLLPDGRGHGPAGDTGGDESGSDSTGRDATGGDAADGGSDGSGAGTDGSGAGGSGAGGSGGGS